MNWAKWAFIPFQATGCQGREGVTPSGRAMKRSRGREMNGLPPFLGKAPLLSQSKPETLGHAHPPLPSIHLPSGQDQVEAPSQRNPGPQTLKTPWRSHASAQSTSGSASWLSHWMNSLLIRVAFQKITKELSLGGERKAQCQQANSALKTTSILASGRSHLAPLGMLLTSLGFQPHPTLSCPRTD